MKKTIWAYTKFLLAIAGMLYGYVLAYGASVIMMYLFLGIFMLPLVIIVFPFALFHVWKNTTKTIQNKTIKIVVLLIAYGVYGYLTYEMNFSMSWSDDGNLAFYLNWN